jgi:hypothetical protein
LPLFSLSVLLEPLVSSPLNIVFHEQQTSKQSERKTQNGEEGETGEEEQKHSNLPF